MAFQGRFPPGERRLVYILIELLAFTVCPDAASLAASPREAKFELRGKVVLPSGFPPEADATSVILEGATFPFSKKSGIRPSGDFRFKDLKAGMYRLIIRVERWGSQEVSVDLGPSTTDEKGRMIREFVFRPDPASDAGATVSWDQLSVDWRAQRALAEAEELLGKHEEEKAVRRLKEALRISPHYAAAWNRLGTIHFLNRRYAEARDCFLEALRYEPSQYAATVNLGAAYLELFEPYKALEWNLKATEARPNDPLAHSQLGQTYFVLGRFIEAEAELKRAKELDPAHFSHPQLVLAEIYRQRGDYAAAAAELEDFLAQHPDDPSADAVKSYLEALRRKAADENAPEGK